MENGEIWQLVAVGLTKNFMPPDSPDFQPRSDQETAIEIAQRASDARAFFVVAYPQCSQMLLADAASIKAAHAVEILQSRLLRRLRSRLWISRLRAATFDGPETTALRY